jgi:predicted ATPase
MESNRLRRMTVRNFRSLEDLSIETSHLNVFFGPNGAGKSTLLDTIWFFRDCAIRGVDTAASERDHGIGVLWDGAEEGDGISIEIETASARHKISLNLSAGRIEPFVGEELVSADGRVFIKRSMGSNKASFYHQELYQNL